MALDKTEYLLCKNLAYIRRVKGLSQKEMAQILGVGVEKVRKIERFDPRVRLSCVIACQACNAFRISADALLRIDLSDPE